MKKYNRILGQMLDLVSRLEFEKLENTKKYSKGFSVWMHFVLMPWL